MPSTSSHGPCGTRRWSRRKRTRKEIDRIAEQRKIIVDRLEKAQPVHQVRCRKGEAEGARRGAQRLRAGPGQVHGHPKNGKKEDAVEYLLTTVRTAQNGYLKAVNDLVTFQTELMDKSGKSAAEAYDAARMTLIAISPPS